MGRIGAIWRSLMGRGESERMAKLTEAYADAAADPDYEWVGMADTHGPGEPVEGAIVLEGDLAPDMGAVACREPERAATHDGMCPASEGGECEPGWGCHPDGDEAKQAEVWELHVMYVHSQGWRDEEIFEAVGRESVASGGDHHGWRDLHFEFDTSGEAVRAGARVSALKGVTASVKKVER